MRKTKNKPISWAFGFKPVPCKGGKTTNSLVGDTMIHREMKEAKEKQTMREWKTFRLNGKLLAAYTLKDTFPGEEADTLAFLAYEHNCKAEDITVAIEEGTPK